jgi:hypothetical protein
VCRQPVSRKEAGERDGPQRVLELPAHPSPPKIHKMQPALIPDILQSLRPASIWLPSNTTDPCFPSRLQGCLHQFIPSLLFPYSSTAKLKLERRGGGAEKGVKNRGSVAVHVLRVREDMMERRITQGNKGGADVRFVARLRTVLASTRLHPLPLKAKAPPTPFCFPNPPPPIATPPPQFNKRLPTQNSEATGRSPSHRSLIARCQSATTITFLSEIA